MSIYLTADTHFNHTNIIKYCHRPFTSVEEMNDTLVKNWNSVVDSKDTVLFLGDLCFKDSIDTWLSRLNGNKVMIMGNHDRTGEAEVKFEYKGEIFLLTHRVASLIGRNIWNIHGHSHNKGILIDKENKSICVSTELTDFSPIAINRLLLLRGNINVL